MEWPFQNLKGLSKFEKPFKKDEGPFKHLKGFLKFERPFKFEKTL